MNNEFHKLLAQRIRDLLFKATETAALTSRIWYTRKARWCFALCKAKAPNICFAHSNACELLCAQQTTQSTVAAHFYICMCINLLDGDVEVYRLVIGNRALIISLPERGKSHF